MSEPVGNSRMWPNAHTLYHSRLYAFFQELEATAPARERVHGVMIRLLLRYAYGECLFLADAVARVAGQPGRLVRFGIATPETEDRLVHAVLCLGSGPLTEATPALDVLGVSELGAIARSMEGLGPIAWEEIPAEDRPRPGEYPAEDAETALRVAGCLPWLAAHVPARYRVGERCALACLTEIADDPDFLKHRNG